MTNTCASCGTTKVALYDEGFERYFCDIRCHSDYCAEHFDAIYATWSEQNLEEVDV